MEKILPQRVYFVEAWDKTEKVWVAQPWWAFTRAAGREKLAECRATYAYRRERYRLTPYGPIS